MILEVDVHPFLTPKPKKRGAEAGARKSSFFESRSTANRGETQRRALSLYAQAVAQATRLRLETDAPFFSR